MCGACGGVGEVQGVAALWLAQALGHRASQLLYIYHH